MEERPLEYASQQSVNRGGLFAGWIGLAAGVFLTAPCVMLAILSAGAGHGGYGAARLFFPISMLLTQWTGNTIGLASIGVALLQFPLYGFVVGAAVKMGWRLALVAVSVVAAIHITFAAICFSGALPTFS